MDPCLGLVEFQHDAEALNASGNVFFVLMTIPEHPCVVPLTAVNTLLPSAIGRSQCNLEYKPTSF